MSNFMHMSIPIALNEAIPMLMTCTIQKSLVEPKYQDF